jgi:phosphohistidine swiveling domain-containing protein
MDEAWNQPFEPPGPGSWFLDATHFTRPSTPFYAETWTAPASAGFAAAARRHGVLSGDVVFRHVNGFVYAWRGVRDSSGQPRPLASEAEVRALIENDAELAERAEAAAWTIRERGWRDDLFNWDDHDKPALLGGHRALLGVDPSTLRGDDLIDHICACREHLIRAVYAHHRYTIPCLLPVGDLMAHVESWTGRPSDGVLQLLRGSSPVSLGADDELREAAIAIRADAAARALLEAEGDAGDCLDLLRRLPGATRRATITYLDLIGHRPVNGHDVGEPCAIEMPGLVLRTLREAVEGTTAARRGDTDDRLAELRAEVPAPHRQEFDTLLGEARIINRLRDERDLLADGTAEGITRRAILAAGRVLAASGAVDDPTHLVEASFGEIRDLLLLRGGPSARELSDRAEYAGRVSPSDAPPLLGPPPQAALPSEWLPPAMARVERAVDLGLGAIFGTPPDDTSAGIRGVGTGGGVYTGPARVVRGTADFARVRPGDVLVASGTSPAFNVVLPLIAAIVTDSGALLSHAAIVAREAGIPGVVGCGNATARIPEGASVRVDANTGEVTVYAAPDKPHTPKGKE